MISLHKINEIKDLISQLNPESLRTASDFLEFLNMKRLNRNLTEDTHINEVSSKVDNLDSSDIVSALKVIRCLVTEQELEQLSLDMEQLQSSGLSLEDYLKS